MASITVDGIVKTFGGQQVLRDLSPHPGRRVLYAAGAQRCGKTTLLRCIAAFTRPTAAACCSTRTT